MTATLTPFARTIRQIGPIERAALAAELAAQKTGDPS